MTPADLFLYAVAVTAGVAVAAAVAWSLWTFADWAINELRFKQRMRHRQTQNKIDREAGQEYDRTIGI